MKFKLILTSRATVRKKDKYEFNEIPNELIEEGKKRDFSNQLLVKLDKSFDVYGIYSRDNKIIITMYHSFDKFEEIKEDK